MRWFARVLLTTLLAGTLQGSQDHAVSYGQTEERVAGLLDLPEILGDFGCKEIRPQRVVLYPAPSRERPSVGTIETRAHKSAPTAAPPLCELGDSVPVVHNRAHKL